MNTYPTRRGQSFTQRALIAVALGLLALVIAYLVRQVGQVLLVLFAGVLLAVLIDGLTRVLRRVVPIKRGWAVVVTVVLLLALISALSWFFGPPLVKQFIQLADSLPQTIDQIRSQLQGIPWLSSLLQRFSDSESQGFISIGAGLMARLAGVFSTAVGVLVNIVIIVFLGLYLAFSPQLHIKPITYLVPSQKRRRANAVFAQIGRALRHWLAGRFISMTVVGVLVGLGLWALGMPVPVSLGFIAAVLCFIPYIGPILSAVPALLLAFGQGLWMVVYVAILYLVVQTVESYFITPMIQERAVSLPPGYLVIAQVLGGVLFGIIGILLAAPLGVAITVMIQMLYVEDVLDEQPHVMGEE